MNNYTLQKKLLELKELYGKNIDKMDKVLFLKNIKMVKNNGNRF